MVSLSFVPGDRRRYPALGIVNSILEKESQYKSQMQPIREMMFATLASLNPTAIRRGRHAHSSATIEIGDVRGIIDIQMNTKPWEDMPDSISDDYPFELWAYAHLAVDRSRVSEHEMHWELPFRELDPNVSRFISLAIQFISGLKSVDFTTAKRIPSDNPDRLPDLRGPRPAKFAG